VNNSVKKLNSALGDEIAVFNNKLLNTDWSSLNFDGMYSLNELYPDMNASQVELINGLVRLIPEWKRLIDCRQHKTHDYCLGLHTFLVMKKVKENARFQGFCDFDKLVLLYTALLHDIAKPEDKVDYEHPCKGSDIALCALGRLGFDRDFISEVCTLIKNHQVLGFLAIGRITPDEIDKNLFNKRVELVDFLEILTEADIKAVKRNEFFYNNEIEQKIRKFSSKMRSYYKQL